MAIPLLTVLTAAPSVISAATDLIRIIRERKSGKKETASTADRIAELEGMLEKQAELIEELAINNRNLALAVRNNRIFATIVFVVALFAIWMAML